MTELKQNHLVIDDTVYETKLTRKFRFRKKYEAPNPKHLNAFIPGIITDIYVKSGQYVKEGDKILILEAMKMKNTVTAEITGKVKEIKISSGNMVTKNQLLIVFE
ncbi:MAG: acetyl-CoA carboxylase biotin carboxyl carrier protein subunit [Bacteroidota bacterium]